MSQFENLRIKTDQMKAKEFSNQLMFKFSNLNNL
jgi:hypothetical protein